MADRSSFASSSNNAQGHTANSNEFQRLSHVISNNIQKITGNVNQLETLQKQMSTKPDNMELKDKFHQIQHYVNQLARDTTKYLKDLSAIPPSGLMSEQKQHKLQKERLTSDFTNVLNKFQTLQRQEKNIESEELRKRTSSHQNDPYGQQQGRDGTFGGLGSDHQQQQQSVLQIDASEIDMEIMREREDALNKLESDISDVNQIFKDLGMLVHEQGEVIDSIEANTESASANVEQGTDQLRQAQRYSTKARKKKFCIIGTVIAVVAIIIIILAATLSNKT